MGNQQSSLDFKALQRAFIMYDTNMDGHLQAEEYANALLKIGFTPDFKLCELCFRLIDTDRNTTISCDEFKQFMDRLSKVHKPDIFDMIGCAADANGDGIIDSQEMKTVQKFYSKPNFSFQEMTTQQFVHVLRTTK
ncbi:calmodulin-like [Hexamita inflata]|uniref:Calmodulin-like n=1 Tax=Hexamita inflata TaxID=28002 RepID=A0AA86QL26_9EUKA|nr:calmodulin-like [Hexamita inflata]